jgi:hypothetical protein
MAKATVYDTSSSGVTNDSLDEALNDPVLGSMTSVSEFVLWKTQEWRDFIEANYHEKWDEYYRIWRGIWAEEDKTRSTERSRIVTPATTQAVESSVSEVEEATFGHGKPFDIRDDLVDTKRADAPLPPKQPPMGGPMEPPKPPEDADIAFLRQKLTEDMKKQKVRASCSEVLLNAAVYGTGKWHLPRHPSWTDNCRLWGLTSPTGQWSV